MTDQTNKDGIDADVKALQSAWAKVVTSQASYLYDDEELTMEQVQIIVNAAQDAAEKVGVKKLHLDLRQNVPQPSLPKIG